jgi:hypothetical protein
MRWLWKYWPWLPPSRSEALAIIVSVALLAAVLVAMIKFPYLHYGRDDAFGPDWDCAPTPGSEAVCVKRVPPAPPKSALPAD